MKKEELERDVLEAMKDIEAEDSTPETNRWRKHLKNPFTIMLGLILLLLIIMMVVPYRAVKLDPEPTNIPTREDIVSSEISKYRNISADLSKESRANYNLLIYPSHPEIKNLASSIAISSCPPSEICYAKSLFYFVRDEMQYISDPPEGYLENPFEVLSQGGADCDGLTILLANLESAIGLPARFAFIPGHVFLQIKLDEAPSRYKGPDGWISLDPACGHCEFGELSFEAYGSDKKFLYIS